MNKGGYLVTTTGAFLVSRVTPTGQVLIKIKDLLWHVRYGGRGIEEVVRVVRFSDAAWKIKKLAEIDKWKHLFRSNLTNVNLVSRTTNPQLIKLIDNICRPSGANIGKGCLWDVFIVEKKSGISFSDSAGGHTTKITQRRAEIVRKLSLDIFANSDKQILNEIDYALSV